LRKKKKNDEQRTSTMHGIKFDGNDYHRNANGSSHMKCEFDSDMIGEREPQLEKL
jgi:hypothetical protein